MGTRRNTAARDLQALQLRQAGLSFDQIAERLSYSNRGAAHKAYRRAVEARTDTSKISREEAQTLELARLDGLYAAIYPKAAKGDLQAVDRLLKISNQRARIQRLYESVNGPASPAAGDVDGKVIDMAEAAARIRDAVAGKKP